MLPLTIVRDLLEEGELVQVLPGVLERAGQFAVVYAERELMPPQVRAFVDAVVAWAPTDLARELSECRRVVRAQHRRNAHPAP